MISISSAGAEKPPKRYDLSTSSYVFVFYVIFAVACRNYNLGMYDIRHHELMISFLRKRISELPHGFFGQVNGMPFVYITYDPTDHSVSKSNKKRYGINTVNGKVWTPLIAEYQRLKSKLQQLESLWEYLYKFDPRQIDYPLIKRRTSILTEDYFRNAREYMNPVVMKNPIEYHGHYLRSKNEMLGCQIIEKFGLEYKIEIAIGNDPFNMLYPDFTVNVPYQQRCISIEINGALSSLKYANKSINRQSTYIENGLMLGKDVVFLDIADISQFYAELFETLLKNAILAGLDDIVFPNGYYNDMFGFSQNSLNDIWKGFGG